MDYEVVTPIKPRKTPSMYETVTKENLPIGTKFSSTVVQVLDAIPPIAGQNGPITWVQMPDTYWVPMVYKTVTYVVEVTPIPNGVPFRLDVDGFLPYEGELTPVV